MQMILSLLSVFTDIFFGFAGSEFSVSIAHLRIMFAFRLCASDRRGRHPWPHAVLDEGRLELRAVPVPVPVQAPVSHEIKAKAFMRPRTLSGHESLAATNHGQHEVVDRCRSMPC